MIVASDCPIAALDFRLAHADAVPFEIGRLEATHPLRTSRRPHCDRKREEHGAMEQAAQDRFWVLADELVAASEIVIDRRRGSAHPRMPQIVYPLDYGYLAKTRAMDGDGVDVWRGSLASPCVTAAIVTVDVFKRDAEVKLLIGCTPDEVQLALATHNQQSQAGLLIRRQP